MATTKLTLVVGALLAAMASFNMSASAATAHNSQTGAGTSNSYDTAASAVSKQIR